MPSHPPSARAGCAIQVERLRKAYRVGSRADVPDTLVSALVGALSAPLANYRRLRALSTAGAGDPETGEDILWAVDGVDLSVTRGEAVGIIGANGAGKSTLLKILSRITEPTSGRVVLNGRVSSLLEVGTGFHPELTGRENIFLNATLLGMRRHEVEGRFDKIVAFSGVERFIDTPVKRYSSGMAVRLAFSVAAHLEPEILLVDEVLAVGDAAFQKQCLGKMEEVATGGRTVLFVSHHMPAIRNLCPRVLVMEHGRVVCDAGPGEAIDHYLSGFCAESGTCDLSANIDQRPGSGAARILSAEVVDHQGVPTATVPMGEGIGVRLWVRAFEPIENQPVSLEVHGAQGEILCRLNSAVTDGFALDLRPGQDVVVDCQIPEMNLWPGTYSLYLALLDRDDRIDEVEHAVSFDVVPADVYGTGRTPYGNNVIFLRASWKSREARASRFPFKT